MCSPIVSLFSYSINLIIVIIVSKDNPNSYLSHSVIVQLHDCQYMTKFTRLHLSNINYNQIKFILCHPIVQSPLFHHETMSVCIICWKQQTAHNLQSILFQLSLHSFKFNAKISKWMNFAFYNYFYINEMIIHSSSYIPYWLIWITPH